MAPPVLSLPARPTNLTLSLEPLTPEAFNPFGTVITSPLPSSLNKPPNSAPSPFYPSHQPITTVANQGTALKTAPISPLTNNYPSTGSKLASKPLMSMFSCFPRQKFLNDQRTGGRSLPLFILERHPYTTQTFSPLGLSPSAPETTFLVIVAPTLSHSLPAKAPSSSSSTWGDVEVPNGPDLSQIRAFVASPEVAQAVTYAPATWHAPMIVVGERRIDFVVTQFVNGVQEDDCQEVILGGALDGWGFDIGLTGNLTPDTENNEDIRMVRVDLAALDRRREVNKNTKGHLREQSKL